MVLAIESAQDSTGQGVTDLAKVRLRWTPGARSVRVSSVRGTFLGPRGGGDSSGTGLILISAKTYANSCMPPRISRTAKTCI